MAASQGVSGEFFLIVVFFCHAFLLTPCPCLSPLAHQELEAGAAATVVIDRQVDGRGTGVGQDTAAREDSAAIAGLLYVPVLLLLLRSRRLLQG